MLSTIYVISFLPANFLFELLRNKVIVAHEQRKPTRPELNPVCVAWSYWEYCHSPRMRCYSIAGLPPAVCRYPFYYTPGWSEMMWGKASYLRKQHDGRDWTSNHHLWSDVQRSQPTKLQIFPSIQNNTICVFPLLQRATASRRTRIMVGTQSRRKVKTLFPLIKRAG